MGEVWHVNPSQKSEPIEPHLKNGYEKNLTMKLETMTPKERVTYVA